MDIANLTLGGIAASAGNVVARRLKSKTNWEAGHRAMVLATSMVAYLAGSPILQAQSSAKRAVEFAPPTVAAKLYKRPLMRSGRVQFCLKQLGRFEGRINGRMTPNTERALRRLRDDYGFKADDVAQDWNLHALLWRQCRDEWTKAGGNLDRFGLAIFASTRTITSTVKPKVEAARVQSVDPVGATEQRLPPAPKNGQPTSVCLPVELREILVRAHGGKPEVASCELPCLPMPPDLERDDAQGYEKRLGFSWCKACVPFAGELMLDDILRIEKAGNLTLCPDPRRMLRARSTGIHQTGVLVADNLRGVRGLFRRDIRAGESHNGVAVVISVSEYAKSLPPRPRAARDASAIQAVLTERLGFKSSRLIELKNPVLAELEDVFGRSGSIKGLLSERLKDAGEVPVFVYFAGLGAVGSDDDEAYLLPANAQANRERTGGFALSTLYQNLSRMGAGQVTVVLEADFASDPKTPIVSPNAPVTREAVLPRTAMRGLVVVSATDRDQRPLEDQETGLSLFTRYFIQGLSGYADAPPAGNGDGTVDSAEAFVFAANRTAIAARKVSGVLQRPTISQAKAMPIGKLGGTVR